VIDARIFFVEKFVRLWVWQGSFLHAWDMFRPHTERMEHEKRAFMEKNYEHVLFVPPANIS
jgi:hypothetical protein